MSLWLPGSTVAFIGTRELDAVALTLRHLFISAATYAGAHDVLVATGAAEGADQAAATAALRAGGRIRLVLPWANYESAWVTLAQKTFRDRVEVVVYTPAQHKEWLESVLTHHPAANRLSRGALMLHARNYGIVAGAAAVIALPQSASPDHLGGTGQGIRVATHLGIPVVNLQVAVDQWALLDRIRLSAAPVVGPTPAHLVRDLEAFVDGVSRGDLAVEQLPLELRRKLAALFSRDQ